MTLQFLVTVIVYPKDIESGDPEDVVAAEIASNLESVPYVRYVEVEAAEPLFLEELLRSLDSKP
jgi:hypothetical protein